MILSMLKNIYFFILPTFLMIVGLKLIISKSSLPKKILGIFFVIFSIRIISAYFLEEVNAAISIHFYKVQSIIFYIIPPLGFLFFRYALQPLRKFSPIDYLHFLPALIHFIELVPFLFGPVELKYKDLQIAKSTPNFGYHYETIAGIIPIKVHFYVKLCSHLIYYSLGFRIWYQYAKFSKSIFYKNNRILIRWVGADIFFKVLSMIVILLYGLGILKKQTFEFSPTDYFLLLDVLFHFGFFILYPKLLNGAIFEMLADEKIKFDPNPSALKSIQFQNLEKLQTYMEVNAPYLEEDFTIKKLAIQVKLNQRSISKLIHDYYEMSFPDYVGNLRLNYLKKIVKEEKDQSGFTIEKLAETCGFGSRQALYKVVQRLHNKTPHQFLEINSSSTEL
ncbi:MAG: hypothetical protein RJA76_659 [Bacteroidota bacterium]